MAKPRYTVAGVTLPFVPRSTVPALICIVPVKVLLAVRLSAPFPLFRKFPAPLITPLFVIV